MPRKAAEKKRKEGPSFAETIESERILGSLPLGGQSVLVARRMVFKDGRVALDVRTFVNDRPTSKGLHIREERIPDFLALIGAEPMRSHVEPDDVPGVLVGAGVTTGGGGSADFEPPAF